MNTTNGKQKIAAFGAACLCLCLGACTPLQLKHSTLMQGKTFTDLEYTMVLDNVAMFLQNSNALPWHLQLTQGSITINDSLNPSFNYTWPSISRMVGISATRAWQEGWTVVPVTDNGQLYSLQQKYQGTVNANPRWFEVGLVSPPDCPSGRYGKRAVWVKPEHLGDLTRLALEVLEATKKTGPASLTIPGPVPRIQ